MKVKKAIEGKILDGHLLNAERPVEWMVLDNFAAGIGELIERTARDDLGIGVVGSVEKKVLDDSRLRLLREDSEDLSMSAVVQSPFARKINFGPDLWNISTKDLPFTNVDLT